MTSISLRRAIIPLFRWPLGVLLLLGGGAASAEPWLSTRFAQNCSACHAPGRKNVAPKERRCTLSCQGCHVNPSGGGLRSAYGKWNEDRWLASFRSKALGNLAMPVPTKDQAYEDGKDFAKLAEKQKDRLQTRGFTLKTNNEIWDDGKEYDRRDNLEKRTVASDEEWLYQIPDPDPYREVSYTRVDGGADFRLLDVSGITNSSTTESGVTTKRKGKTEKTFLMSADLGVRWRPKHRGPSFVYETRALGQSSGQNKENIAATAIRRSMYFMWDDLPWNIYAQAGYYRPMFGNWDTDHRMLSERMVSQTLQESGQAYTLEFQTISVGGSPNLPFANLHLINGQGGGAPNKTTKGFVGAFGVRFVTLGLGFNYSYWRTGKDLANSQRSEVQMHYMGGSIQLARLTLLSSLTTITKDVTGDAFSSGALMGAEGYIRTWREVYVHTQLTSANLAETLVPGKGQQVRLGVRGFLLPGTDVSLHLEQDIQTQNDKITGKQISQVNSRALTTQLHTFF